MLNILGLLFFIEEFGFIYMISDMHATKTLVTFHQSGIFETPNSLEYSHFIEYVVSDAGLGKIAVVAARYLLHVTTFASVPAIEQS